MTTKITTKLWIGILVLIVLSPVGLILPEYFKAGAAWGEWGAYEVKDLVGHIPQGLKKLSSLWSAPLPDYAFPGWDGKELSYRSLAYIVSAVLGIGITVLVIIGIGKFLASKGD